MTGVQTCALPISLYLLCAFALLALARRRTARLPGDLWVLGLLGTAYSVFAFVGLGHEPFLWAIALGVAGLPVYLLMRLRQR